MNGRIEGVSMFNASVLAVLFLVSVGANAQIRPLSLGSDSLVLIGSNGNSVALKPGTITTSFSLTLPTDAGINGDVLQTNGTGDLSWTSASANSAPAGTIIAFAGATCPVGYIDADGSPVLRSSPLGTVLAGAWGPGDGSTTYNTPDLRNRYLRGNGTNADGNGGDAVSLGAYQGDVFQSHYHYMNSPSATSGGNNLYGGGVSGNVAGNSAGNVREPTADPAVGAVRAGTETRPKSYGVLYCIKS